MILVIIKGVKMKKNNHYVPQIYLKQWEQKHKIYTYEVLVPNKNCPIWKRESISRTSSLDYLYLYDINDKISEELEDFFCFEIENQYQNFIDKLNNYSVLNENDFKYISKLIATQHLRTIGGYTRCQKVWVDLFENGIINDTIEIMNKEFQEGILPRNVNKISSIDEKTLPIKTSLVKENDESVFLKVDAIIGKSAWIYSMEYLFSNTYEVLNNVSWCVYEAPEHFNWVTSDDPVILLNCYDENTYDFNGGWASKNTCIIFPLSPKKLLFAQIGVEQDTFYKKASMDFARLIQKFIIEHAFLKVYSLKESSMVSSVRNRTVNRKEFLRIKKEIEQLHENYKNEELLYFK